MKRLNHQRTKSKFDGFQSLPKDNQMKRVSCAPFSSTAQRFVKVQTNTSAPSPCDYQNINNTISNKNQKIIGKCQDNCLQYRIIQYPKPSSCFKSGSYRFSSQKPRVRGTPGPGAQQLHINDSFPKDIQSISIKPISKHNHKIQTPKILKYLQQQRNQKQIKHNHKKSEIVPRLNQIQNQSSLHHYNHTHQFKSKVQRIIFPYSDHQVGPWSYNADLPFKFFKRSQDQIKKQSYQKIDKKSNEKKYLQPFYYNDKLMSSFKKSLNVNKNQLECFGSKQPRFSNKLQYDTNHHGTPSYNTSIRPSTGIINNRKIPFNSTQKRQIYKLQHNDVSPCSYEPQNQFSDVLFRNIRKSSRGSFGTTVQRIIEHNDSITDRKTIFNVDKLQSIGIGQQSNSQLIKQTLQIRKYRSDSDIVRILNQQVNNKTINQKYKYKDKQKKSCKQSSYNDTIPKSISRDILNIKIKNQNVERYQMFLKNRDKLKIKNLIEKKPLIIEVNKRIHAIDEQLKSKKFQKVNKMIQIEKNQSSIFKQNIPQKLIVTNSKKHHKNSSKLYEHITINRLVK